MSKKEKIDVKIVSQEEAFWENVITQSEMEITGLKRSLKLNEFIVENAKIRLEEAKSAR